MFGTDFPSEFVNGRKGFDLLPTLGGIGVGEFRKEGVRNRRVEVGNRFPLCCEMGLGFV